MKGLNLKMLSVALLGAMMTAEAKEIVPLNGNWEFALGPAVEHSAVVDYPTTATIIKEYKNVTIPHTWNDNAVKRINEGEEFYWSKGWYRKEIDCQPEWSGKRIFIKFDAVGTQAIVSLNGEKIGAHKGPYSAFCFEITDKIRKGINLLEVEASNLADHSMVPSQALLQTSFGGIYRPVNILVAEQTCFSPLDFATSGVYVTPTNVSKSSANLQLDIVTSSTKPLSGVKISATLKNREGKVVKTFYKTTDIINGEGKVSLSAEIKRPRLWDGVRDPYMYSVETTISTADGVELDRTVEPVGFRYFEFKPNEGLILNGRHYDVYGASRWQDWEEEGFAITPKQDSVDMALMMELGATGARFGHYQQDETICNLTDSYGLVSFAELCLIPPLVTTDAYHNNCRQQLEELIKQLYNHPSIIVWNLLNEIFPPEKHLKSLNDLAKSLDSIRPTCVVYNRPIKKGQEGWYKIPDLVCSNKYPGWYKNAGDAFGNAGAFATRLRQVQEVRPDVVFGITEYGGGGCISQHQQNPQKPDDTVTGRFFPEEYQSLLHEKQWETLAGHNEYWCKIIWNLADFTWAYAKRGDMLGRNHKGLVTHDRKVKKDAFYYYKANWNKTEPTIYLTSRRHTEREDAVTPVKVYSNSKSVELFVNEVSQGVVTPSEFCVCEWSDIKLNKGVNKIRVEGKYKGKAQSDSCEWTLK
ncbi:MAG: glycoside hydrolase family 2 TIM barrel-domain containing protein [Rikenellaceae bacterium]